MPYGAIFTMNQGKAWRLVQRKVRRLLYDEICQLIASQTINLQSFGFCLNVMGPKLYPKIFDMVNTLHKVVLAWTKTI